MGLEAMNSAISGLQADTGWLDVLSNNISNQNTVAYKAAQVQFADQLSQNLAGALGPSASQGGVDAQEVGLGTKVESLEANFDQGAVQQTGITTDIAIEGNGFLVAKSGDQTYLTRAGNLSFDSNGYLVDANGGLVQGYTASLQYTQQTLNSISATGGPAVITNADLVLNNTDTADIGNIQIQSNMTIPPKATTEVDFQGNLDAYQQPNLLNLDPPAGPTLPVGLMLAQIPPPNGIDTNRMTTVALPGGGFALKQVANLSLPLAGTTTPVPLDNGIITLADVQAFAGNYAWEQQPPIQPAAQATETVYDSLGNPRQITVQFYQVNDLGSSTNPPINPAPGPSQACYAWYAFDTTDGAPVSTADLIGGTSIIQGDMVDPPFDFGGYDQGIPNAGYAGDFLWFNTDGSLASSGGISGPPAPPGVPNGMDPPVVYLPPFNTFPPNSPIPTQGAQITAITLNFCTWGILGQGERNGLISDAQGSYQPVNGVETYVPKNTPYAASQNGYQDGTLQSLNFDETGKIIGTFSNGQDLALAQVVMGNVENPDGLDKIGNNGYQPSVNSGNLYVGLAGQNGLGTVQGSSLESSNVDLTTELTNMILAQEGYDSNARVIGVVAQQMQTLTQLGQGG